MKIKCLGCDALARLVYFYAAQSPQIVDVELFQLGLHQNPADLRARLQARIDAARTASYDAIVLAYGLCGKATAGLTARTIPLIMPRAHDCITLFLGSRQRYQEQFLACPGTYWYSQDYLERNTSAGVSLSLGADGSDDLAAEYAQYVQKYGKDNTDYLMEVMGAWKSHYQRAVFIDLGIGDGRAVAQRAADEAIQHQWTFECLTGDPRLIRQLLAGSWDDDFLTVQPGETITMACDDNVIASERPLLS